MDETYINNCNRKKLKKNKSGLKYTNIIKIINLE